MHIASVVAERYHLGAAVYTRPWPLTLLEFITLRERDRIDDIIAESKALVAAGWGAMAFHAPEKLQQEHDRLAAEAGTTATREEALAEADRVLAAMQRIEARRA